MTELLRRHPARAAIVALLAITVVVALVALGGRARIAIAAVVLLAIFIAVPATAFRGLWRRLLGGMAGAVLFFALALLAIRLRYGGGRLYPDTSTAPVIATSAVASLVSLDYPPGNVAIAPDGRMFFNYHPFAKAERFAPATMFELVDGTPRPFPDAAFQARYQGVFGMTVDRQQRLWLIEPAGLDHARTRLLAFDLRTNTLALEHWFPEGEATFAQDLRVSPDGDTVYLADTGLFDFTAPSLIVFDVQTRSHVRRLQTSPTVQPQHWIIQTPFGPHKLAYGLITFVVGLDGLELSPDGEWLYYAAMSHDTLYKVPTAALRDPSIPEPTLEQQIIEVGRKPLSDGITLDRDGSVLVTDIEHGGIARLGLDGRLATLVRSPTVIWADGVSLAPDGTVVFTDSAIPAYIDQLGRPPTQQRLVDHRPYHLYRFARPPESSQGSSSCLGSTP